MKMHLLVYPINRQVSITQKSLCVLVQNYKKKYCKWVRQCSPYKPTGGIFPSIWTKHTTSNRGRLIFVFSKSCVSFLQSSFNMLVLSWLRLQHRTCHVGTETVVWLVFQRFQLRAQTRRHKTFVKHALWLDCIGIHIRCWFFVKWLTCVRPR